MKKYFAILLLCSLSIIYLCYLAFRPDHVFIANQSRCIENSQKFFVEFFKMIDVKGHNIEIVGPENGELRVNGTDIVYSLPRCTLHKETHLTINCIDLDDENYSIILCHPPGALHYNKSTREYYALFLVKDGSAVSVPVQIKDYSNWYYNTDRSDTEYKRIFSASKTQLDFLQ